MECRSDRCISLVADNLQLKRTIEYLQRQSETVEARVSRTLLSNVRLMLNLQISDLQSELEVVRSERDLTRSASEEQV